MLLKIISTAHLYLFNISYTLSFDVFLLHFFHSIVFFTAFIDPFSFISVDPVIDVKKEVKQQWVD